MIRVESITPRKNIVKYQTHIPIEIPKEVVVPEVTDKIISDSTYKIGKETLLIVKDVDQSEVTLNSETSSKITIKSLSSVIVRSDIGQIDEEWDELLLEKGACVQFQFVEGNWYILSSDGLKLG